METKQNKYCSRCKTTKPLTAYNNNRRARDGKQPWCRICQNSHKKTYTKTKKQSEELEPKYYVYGLVHPYLDLVFYIGHGFGDRLKSHYEKVRLGEMPNNNPQLYDIIKSFGKYEHPKYKIFYEKLTKPEAMIHEQYLVNLFGLNTLANLINPSDEWSKSVTRHYLDDDTLNCWRVTDSIDCVKQHLKNKQIKSAVDFLDGLING